jgi:Ca2+-binding EF-hand superfamily protein
MFEGSSGLNELSGLVKVEFTSKEEDQIKEIFELFDTDGGGTMDSRELDAAKFSLGFDRSHKNRRESVQSSARTQLITLEEFSSMMKGEKLARGPFDGVWMVFSVLCAQGGESNEAPAKGRFNGASKPQAGRITLEGLRKACNQFNVRLSEDEVQEMMAEADPSGTGKVDIDSFFRMVGSAPWF